MTTFGSNGGLHVVALGVNRDVVFKTNPTAVVGGFQPVQSLGGYAQFYPAALTYGNKFHETFVIGLDCHLYCKVHDVTGDAANDAGWYDLGGICKSAPQVASSGKDSICVVVMGGDSKAYACMWNGTKWDWMSLGVDLIHEDSLTICSWGPGRYDVFGVGYLGALRHVYYTGGKWSPWEGIPNDRGSWQGQPKVVACRNNRLDVFCRGTDQKIWQTGWNGSKWLDCKLVQDKRIMFGPEPVVWCGHRIDLFAINEGSGLMHTWADVSGTELGTFTTFGELGGQYIQHPKAVCREGKYVDVFNININSTMAHRQWDGEQWRNGATDDQIMGGTFTSRAA